MTIDLLDPALTERWRRGGARRRSAIRAHVARQRGVDERCVVLEPRGSEVRVRLRPVPAQLELALDGAPRNT